MRNRPLFRIAICGMMMAIDIMLQTLLVVKVPLPGNMVALNLGLQIVPALVCGLFFGSIYGGFVHGGANLISALLFPYGDFNILFSLVAGMIAFTASFVYRRWTHCDTTHFPFMKVWLSLLVGLILFSTGANSFLLLKYYGNPQNTLPMFFAVRSIALLASPVQALVTVYMCKLFRKLTYKG